MGGPSIRLGPAFGCVEGGVPSRGADRGCTRSRGRAVATRAFGCRHRPRPAGAGGVGALKPVVVSGGGRRRVTRRRQEPGHVRAEAA